MDVGLHKRRLGRTGLDVSILGLGGHTYPIGDGDEAFRTPDDRTALVGSLLDAGVNYYDTPWMNEVDLLADSFRRLGADGNAFVSLQYVDGVSDPRWRDRLRGELEARLKVMRRGRAKLFLMGVGNGKPPLSEIVSALEAMAKLRDEGLVENIGLSCHELGHFGFIADAIERTDLVDYMMLRYNWKHRDAADRLLPLAKARDIGVVGMKVFCWDCGPGQWVRRISVFEPTRDAERLTPEPTPSQRSLQWCWSHPAVAAVVPSINAEWEAEMNIRAAGWLEAEPNTSDFDGFAQRLWRRQNVEEIAAHSASQTIRNLADSLLPQLR
jgi:predicted aldo/keto reductase-like oxidoreductase